MSRTAQHLFCPYAFAVLAISCQFAGADANAQDEKGHAAPTCETCLPELAGAHELEFRNLAIIAGEALGVAWYGKQNWWNDGFQGKFRTVNEGWFGQDTYAGGADKLGHFYMNYVGARLFSKVFRYAGNDPEQALYLGAGMVLGTMTAVEVLDGYSKRWRFSREDAVMNALGAGTALLLEKFPQIDELIDFRFHYHQSGQSERFDPFGDYAGQTYVVAFKASGVPALRDHPWLRYVELAAGYGTRNYAANPGELSSHPYRQVYVGISLNLSELLRKADPEQHLPGRPVLDTALEYVQVPGTAVFRRHRLPGD